MSRKTDIIDIGLNSAKFVIFALRKSKMNLKAKAYIESELKTPHTQS